MKVILFIQFILVLGIAGDSIIKYQNSYSTIQVEADRKASFPGGAEKMNEWIKANLRAPIENVRYGIVRVEFTVKKSCKLSDFVIKKGINKDMDFAAIECLQGMPIWNPAIEQGKKVNQVVTIPVQFSPSEQE